MDWWIWAIPLAMYLTGAWHHWRATKLFERAQAFDHNWETRLKMLREANELWRYGARAEAEGMIEDAIALKADCK